MMSLGGNRNLKLLFAEYDLLDEVPQNRYKTVSADYYRKKLQCLASGESLFDEKPDYVDGKTIIVEQVRNEVFVATNKSSDSDEEVEPTDVLVDLFKDGLRVTSKVVNVIFEKTNDTLDKTGATDYIKQKSENISDKTQEYY